MNAVETNSHGKIQSTLFNLFLAVLVTFGVMKLVESVQFGAITRFFSFDVFLVALAIVGVALVLLDRETLTQTSWTTRVVALACLTLTILMISRISQITLVVVVLLLLSVIFVTAQGKIRHASTPKDAIVI